MSGFDDMILNVEKLKTQTIDEKRCVFDRVGKVELPFKLTHQVRRFSHKWQHPFPPSNQLSFSTRKSTLLHSFTFK